MNVSHQLFLIIPPGLEDLAQKEVELKCPVSGINPVKGGLELTANIEWIEKAHLLLRIPTRILLRMSVSKIRDLPKLYQKFQSLKLNNYLSHPEPIWHISSSKSRLSHTGRIEETLKESFKEFLRRNPMSLEYQKKGYDPQNVYLRFEDDLCTISLDLTGEPLYKRGIQMIKGEAPIRENFAAAMLFELFEAEHKDITLVDPTCGSGTFLTEARYFFSPIHFRKFAFEETPLFKGRIIKKQQILENGLANTYIGNDLQKDLIEKLELDSQIKLQVGDALEKQFTENSHYMICNPPYGMRIQIEGKKGHFLKKLWMKLLNVDRPLKLGMVLPSDFDELFLDPPPPYKTVSKRKFRNGGLMVSYWIWSR